MPTYAIGDVQGCFNELQALLQLIRFDSQCDQLWFTGDLVNRGPQSLDVLRFARETPGVISVLGNHDLALLALAYTKQPIEHHTLTPILEAPDREVLLTWLRNRPLIYQNNHYPYVLVHAGILPHWTVPQAIGYAKEVEQVLQSEGYLALLENMFGKEPSRWSETLTSWPRYRFIINCLTRLRFCDQNGNLALNYKGTIQAAPPELTPWFKVPLRKHKDDLIIFGHWAALQGQADEPTVFPLDTGCVWGQCLTAMRLEDRRLFWVPCKG